MEVASPTPPERVTAASPPQQAKVTVAVTTSAGQPKQPPEPAKVPATPEKATFPALGEQAQGNSTPASQVSGTEKTSETRSTAAMISPAPVSPRFIVPRSPSGPSIGSPTALKAGPGSPKSGRATPAENTSFKREIDSLHTQLARHKEAHAFELDKFERISQGAVQRLEKKLSCHDTQHAKADRKVSELCGGFRGLSDEVQDQVRRFDTFDSRFWEFRRQLEEDVRKKLAEYEEAQSEALSKCRKRVAASEDATKKLEATVKRLEDVLCERLPDGDRLENLATEVHSRIDGLDDSLQQHRDALDELGGTLDGGGQSPGALEHQPPQELVDRLEEISEVLRNFRDKAFGEQGWDARLQEVDVRYQGLRVKLEGLENHNTKFREDHRQDLEARMESVQKWISDFQRRHCEHDENLQALGRRTGDAEAVVEQMRSSRLADTLQLGPALPRLVQLEARVDQLESEDGQGSSEVKIGRLKQIEARVDILEHAAQAHHWLTPEATESY